MKPVNRRVALTRSDSNLAKISLLQVMQRGDRTIQWPQEVKDPNNNEIYLLSHVKGDGNAIYHHEVENTLENGLNESYDALYNLSKEELITMCKSQIAIIDEQSDLIKEMQSEIEKLNKLQ